MECSEDDILLNPQLFIEALLFPAVIGTIAFLIYCDVTGNLTITPTIKVGILYLAIFIPVAVARFFTVWLYLKKPLWYWFTHVLCTVIMWYCGFTGVIVIVTQRTFLLSSVLLQLFC